MYLDTQSELVGMPVDQTTAAALASSSLDALSAKLVDAEVENGSNADEGSDGEAVAVAHPLGTVDQLALAFQILRANAQDDLEQSFVDGLKDLSQRQTPLPWTARGPSLQSAIRFTGVEPTNEDQELRFASLLGLAAHLLTPAVAHRPRRTIQRSNPDAFISRVRLALDVLPHGTLIPSRWGSRISWIGLARMLGLSQAELKRNAQATKEISNRLEDGRLVLGPVFRESEKVAKEVAASRRRLITIFEKRVAAGQPFEVEAHGRHKILIGPLLDEAGIDVSAMRDRLTADALVRKALTDAIASVGTCYPGQAAGNDKPLLTFDDLQKAGVEEAEEAFCSRNPEASEDAIRKASSTELSFLNRAMRANGWDLQGDVTTTLLGEDAAASIAKGCNGNTRGDKNYRTALDRWSKTATKLLAARKLGVTFHQRLSAGIDELGYSKRAFSARVDMPYDMLMRWCRNNKTPTSHQLHYVHRIERLFGLPKGELVGMLGVVRGGRNNTARKTIKLDDGRVVKLSKYLPFLPADALDESEERLREAVAQADRTHFGSQTVNTIRQKAVAAISRERIVIDPSCPILREWDRLVAFKTAMIDSNRYLCGKWAWKSSHTIESNAGHMRNFARWCAMPRDEGGLGLPWSKISFILILNPQNIQKYLMHRILRFSHLTLGGEELGPMLGATELNFLGFMQSLLDLEYGWLTQSRHEVKAAETIQTTFPLEVMSELDGVFKVEMPPEPSICTVMSKELVGSIEADWIGAVRHSRHMIASMKGKVDGHYKMIRDPQKLIMPILNHQFPIAVVLRQVKEALKQCRPIEVDRLQHAKDYRNAVAMLLLCTVVFRSGTLRNMLWKADGTGHLIRTAVGYDVVVGADRFKNGMCEWLFGPSYRRKDYERALGDWGSLTKILDYYLEVCRPILLNGRTSDLLFPTGGSAKEWSHKVFNAMITNWTRTWSVRNERYGTGMTGVLPWGPHCIRDIVATHIIMHFDSEQRWELASAILCTGVDQVKKRYAFVNRKRELGKADPIYAEAFRLGFGNEDLSAFALAA